MQQISYQTLELIPGGILTQNHLLQTAQPAGAMSDRDQTAEAESTSPYPKGLLIGSGAYFQDHDPWDLPKKSQRAVRSGWHRRWGAHRILILPARCP